MGLDVFSRRPVAVLAARSTAQGTTVTDPRVRPYAPPTTVSEGGFERVAGEVVELCVRILRGIVLGEDLSTLRARLAPDAVTWSPHVFALSRDQLLSNVDTAGLAGETLTEVALEVTDISAARHRVFVEWRLTARFTGPGFIDDDLLIEPNGRLLETAGIEVVSFNGAQVVSVHCYYDDLALFEQLITAR